MSPSRIKEFHIRLGAIVIQPVSYSSWIQINVEYKFEVVKITKKRIYIHLFSIHVRNKYKSEYPYYKFEDTSVG